VPSVQAKVADILTEYLLAINAGSMNGVSERDVVSLKQIVEIMDPDTGEKLGTVAVSKLILQVNHVQSKLCTATVISTRDTDAPNSSVRVPQKKKIVHTELDAKQGVSVCVSIGDRADIELSGFSDEPPF